MKKMTTKRNKCVLLSKDDHSWDLVKSNKGNLPTNAATFDRKYEEWMKRDWLCWLKASLAFPFEIKRKEDDDDAYFTDIAKYSPFRLGHVMQAISIEEDCEDRNGIYFTVKEGKKIGHVPICDVEVTSKDDKNYWPVREYVVWDANK